MHLIKVVFAFLVIGGASYAVFKIETETPEWIKNVSYLMAIAAVIMAVTSIPSAIQAFEETKPIIARWLEAIPRMPVKDRNEMVWKIKSNHPNIVYVKFFAPNRLGVWPSGTEAYLMNASSTKSFPLACNAGEKICFGAFTANRTTTWGVGENNTQSCNNCCYYCGRDSNQIVLNPP